MRSLVHFHKAGTKALGFLRMPLYVLACVVWLTQAQSGVIYGGWRSTGPYGGDAAVVRVVPATRGMVLAAARNGLLYSSENGGAGWVNIPFPGQFTGALHALEVDPRSEGTWYVGIEGDRTWASGVWKTSDQGRTWTLLPEITGKAVWSLALSPRNPDVIAGGNG